MQVTENDVPLNNEKLFSLSNFKQVLLQNCDSNLIIKFSLLQNRLQSYFISKIANY